MSLFNIIAIIISISAIFSFINHKYIKLPSTIGIMLISFIVSLGIILSGKLGFDTGVTSLVRLIDFNEALMIGMLSYLLFAGSLHVNLDDLLKNKLEIGTFASIGVMLSTFICGSLIYFVFWITKNPIGYIYCLLFGALISPTDPIAVMGILKHAGAPKKLEIKIAGESLFNDGIGVVVFLTIAGIASGESHLSAGHISHIIIQEVAGGVFLGLGLGYFSYLLLKQVDHYQVEILITLALVTGGYALALFLHISGPITIVIAGLLIGNKGRQFAMSEKTKEHLDTFWELIDDILNSVLFVLIGFEILVISISGYFIFMGFIAVFIVLFARFISIGIPVFFLRKIRTFSPGAVKLLTWGGLRGGISIALAMSLPLSPVRDLIVTMTYIVVIFSLLFQGLTMEKLVRKYGTKKEDCSN
jgi:CPA1 family monovalent cation:H+ antiporter